MSYDLNFWKLKRPTDGTNQEIYERLSDGEKVDGLEELPITKINIQINKEFKTAKWTQLDELNWESEKGSFQIFTTPQFYRVDCYGMAGEDMNKIIEILAKFDCPLFDPQTGVRYENSKQTNLLSRIRKKMKF